ncbi:MAG: efflux RND transporter periplasmic adaptor subunit [Caldilinea sp.]|nr:efflux RND transporter periplasmic adaptor subunit [Caldilineaceae bacterium]MCO5210220.1 efflux RND transporter periplasmic adaptor subunit [Caldilinea sp.]
MQATQHHSRPRWPTFLLVAGLLAGAGYYVWNFTALPTQISWPQLPVTTTTDTAAGAALQSDLATVTIQQADLVVSQVSASGNLALMAERPVVLAAGGTVAGVAVEVGDAVRAGDRLLTLDTTALERSARLAELDVESAQNQLAAVTEAATASELAVAEADLLEAQENLADVQAGPSTAELAAARSALAAAQASHNELLAGPSQDELTQLAADMKTAQVAVAEAQSAYDQVAWQTSAGTSSEAADLQSATITFEAARAAYAESTAAAATSDVQSALSTIQDAQVALDDLLNSPTAAEVATAQAQLADAQASLDDLKAGASETDLTDARITLEQALVALEEAYTTLDAATVVAPMDGVVMALDASVGEQLNEGAEVATLADLSQVELTINVSELDIPRVSEGQAAQVQIDALAGQTFDGTVARISPASDADSSAVTYPVTIRLTGVAAAGVLPGMSAIGTLVDDSLDATSSWLVPTNSIRTQDGASVVRIVRDGQPVAVTVTTGSVQGEWTVVQSPELQSGDQVLGSVATYVGETESRFPMGPMGDMGAPPAGGPPPGG